MIDRRTFLGLVAGAAAMSVVPCAAPADVVYTYLLPPARPISWVLMSISWEAGGVERSWAGDHKDDPLKWTGEGPEPKGLRCASWDTPWDRVS